ncbi:Pyrimidine/purine nucleoside phosphorylase [Candidatus Nitrotoga sp. HW29]|uniref:pyrimidine/purine nucleoside phosphorylase n=1 Tax=Candidatus Nitrotoga sp. HW29 TaxID=2886963 RepID=UPI001EF2D5F2|nr:pyrimidine/purine nucleoside phosphorylase [Candidatus Nitrotoga sp. HW29]CAH1906491.1 Pyrimidine/purine nucleoside phosphorylase [Candidatus Nitrotoga sp. HW29]
MSQFDNVSVVKKANVFFDGKCVSHSVLFPDGARKTVGVIMPGSRLTFNVSTPELMEITSGTCQVKISGDDAAKTYTAGMQFNVAANSSFEIHTQDTVDYVCSFG